jgi:hypothetical protein
MKRTAFLLVLLILGTSYAFSTTLSLGEFWCELEPMFRDDEEYPLPEEEAVKRVLEEARYVISAMLYGFRFVYTPYDAKRQIDEFFTLDAVATIPWGDPSLIINSSRVENKKLLVNIRYRVNEYQEPWLRSWESVALATSSGMGAKPMYVGYGQRLAAIEDALREAVRAYLRGIVYNKPREVRGTLVLKKKPVIRIESGNYLVSVQIALQLDEIVPYTAF